jgi:penicillin G amidase
MRRNLTRVLKVFATTLIIVILLALGGGYILLTRSFPQTSGTIKIGASDSPLPKHSVEIIRDRTGVPHLYADNADDLFFAQGYVHAQDRLWQMELNRHVGHGQLAELFGDIEFGNSTTVKVDKFLRTIGLDRAARADLNALDGETRRYLQSYAGGVNAFLHSHSDNLPLEFTLLGYRPTEWQAVDTLVWAKVMAYDLSGDYEDELFRTQLINALGEARVKQLLPSYPASGPFIIPPEVKRFTTLAPSSFPVQAAKGGPEVAIGQPDLAELERITSSLELGAEGVGSNNWVVDGTRTSTGKPLLANDPHLDISMPSIWYTNGLHCTPVSAACPFNVIGYTFPGVPGVVIGHNERIAWGVTNTGPDVQDLFMEKVNPANPNQYWYQGHWHDMELDPQVIHVKNGADLSFTVQYTQHGPIMTPVLKGVTATLALEWTATKERSGLVNSLIALDSARNWDEFRSALRLWDVPAQNFVYADVDNNIGYQMPGRIPIRASGDGTVPVPGWSGEYEWTGYIPFDELPFVLNPPSHFIVTANNQVVPSDYKYLIASNFAAPFRAKRISDLLAAMATVSPDDFKRIQGDVYSLPLIKLQKYVVQVNPVGFLPERALKYVKDWDGNLTQDNIGGTILEVTYLNLVSDLFEPQLGADLFTQYLQRGRVHHLLVDELLDDPSNPIWADPSTSRQERRDGLVAKAYFEGVDWLGSQFGDWPPDWHWGRLHTATFAHPFGSIRPLDLIFNFGPIGVPGDGYTVFNTGFDQSKPYGDQTVSSMREIIDLSDLDGSWWIQTTGESGQPLNSHYADLTPMWRDVKYAPLYFTREAVEKVNSGDLVLMP